MRSVEQLEAFFAKRDVTVTGRFLKSYDPAKNQINYTSFKDDVYVGDRSGNFSSFQVKGEEFSCAYDRIGRMMHYSSRWGFGDLMEYYLVKTSPTLLVGSVSSMTQETRILQPLLKLGFKIVSTTPTRHEGENHLVHLIVWNAQEQSSEV